jgi:RNA polymerase sigma-70 factor (ECF subfamily)
MKDELEYAPSVRVPAGLRRIVDADDLRQAAMLRFYRRAAKFRWRSDGECRTYLRRSFVSALIDALRHENRARRSGVRVAVALEEIAAELSTPSRKMMRDERRAILSQNLFKALDALPADQRTAVTLHHLRGQTLIEAAEAMGKTSDAVAGLLRRALPTLKSLLAGCEDA